LGRHDKNLEQTGTLIRKVFLHFGCKRYSWAISSLKTLIANLFAPYGDKWEQNKEIRLYAQHTHAFPRCLFIIRLHRPYYVRRRGLLLPTE